MDQFFQKKTADYDGTLHSKGARCGAIFPGSGWPSTSATQIDIDKRKEMTTEMRPLNLKKKPPNFPCLKNQFRIAILL